MTIANLQKVVWSEGVLLGQQHLQQWERYQEMRQIFWLSALTPYCFGLKSLEIDEKSLSLGMLVIKKCQLIFPNGLCIDYNNKLDQPLSYDLSSIANPVTSIFLATPIMQGAKGIPGYREPLTSVCWLAQYYSIQDEYDSQREREILLAKPQLVLLSEKDERSMYMTMKIIELNRINTVEFQLSKMFIPKVLTIQASSTLKDLLQEYILLLSTNIRLLQERQRQIDSATTSLTYSAMTSFMLLQLLNGTLPNLQHLFQQPSHHPIYFYRCLCYLIASLTTFSALENAYNLPEYHENDLAHTFTQLDQLLKRVLPAAIPPAKSLLQLQRENEMLYKIDKIEEQFFKGHFYIAISLQVEDRQWPLLFERQVKVGAYSMIETIVASALVGVKITHIQQLPQKLFIRPGYTYFYIEPIGDFWEQVKKEKTIALFIPYAFINSKVELITVEE